jgi:hypothetical protein
VVNGKKIINYIKIMAKKMNAFMQAKEVARKGNKPSFSYKGNTYVQKKVGSLTIYKKK